MTSSDKDFRFMATNDLMAELQKDSIKLDDDSERKVPWTPHIIPSIKRIIAKHFVKLFIVSLKCT